ncbi:phage tail tip lysozyme [Pseudomonas sp. dw_358]|uniref:phage tail tip lysozyme n=1 Tax=Pseudomonas sp. dw_358 TaxID=2720083 RepID=UPI001BD4E4B1|nr:phage tail tip lysozyme [Pseudomonas sp. dw_358]
MPEEEIDALLVKLGVTVDQASFTESTNAVNSLDKAINKAARERGKTGIDQIGKDMSHAGGSAKELEQTVDKFDKTVAKVPRSVNVLQSRLGSATVQMTSFRKETQAVVALLSRGASATGLGPLSGSMFSMLAGGGPLALAATAFGGLAANSYSFANGALNAEVTSSSYGVSKSDLQNFDRYGKKITGEDDVGKQVLAAAQRLRQSSAAGIVPVDIARFGGSPSDFADAYKRPTMEVVDLIQKQIRNARDDVSRQNIGNALGLSQAGIMTVNGDFRAGIQAANKPGSTFTDKDVADARAFEDSLVDLTADFDRLRNKLGSEFLPSLDSFVKRVDSMFAQDGLVDKVTQTISQLKAGNFSGALQTLQSKSITDAAGGTIGKNPIPAIASGLYHGAVDGYHKNGILGAYTGGLGGGLGAIGGMLPGGVKDMASQGFNSASSGAQGWLGAHDTRLTAKRDQYLKFFTDNGYSQTQAAGIVGNLMSESSLNASAVSPDGGAIGLAQWRGSRQKDFKEFFGGDLKGSSETDQLNFILYELQNKEKSANSALLKTSTAADAASVFRNMYERPGESQEDEARRILYANQAAVAPNAVAAKDTSANTDADREIEARRILYANQAAAPSTYNMVANSPAPPTVNAMGMSSDTPAGTTVHIDARGSTDPHHVTNEAMRALNQQLQGHMAVTMSHLSTDLDQ